jgi:hypothetical protein
MILCIEIDQNTKAKLDQLLKGGQYRDYSQAVAVAVTNQVLLHERVIQQGGALVVDERTSGAYSNKPIMDLGRTLPEIFRLPEPHSGLKLAPIPTDVFVPGAPVPLDRWIFGQHNKLLPVKASCRCLANISVNGHGVPLSKAASEISAYASLLGDYLQSVDERNSLTRDEVLGAAFPAKRRDVDGKGRLRFANQFVGSVNKHGQLSGLLVDLKLINVIPGKEPRVLLTEPGWQFAVRENPILDGGSDRPPRFSQEEILLLLEHIRLRVPAEDFALRTITKALLEGASSPEKLDAYLKRFLPQREDKPFTDAFLTTQRAGAVSRMADLGLLQKERSGVRVTYVASDRAVRYLTESEGK